MKLGLAIPLLNEADSITEVVASTHAVLAEAGIDHTLVLVNNGSQDHSREVIDSLVVPGMIEAVHLRENVGYGGGILTGLAHLERQGFPEVIGWAWGDGQVSATALPPLFNAIQAGADVAKALRTERHDGPWRQAVTAGYSATMRMLGVHTRDINGCPKLMTREAFTAIQPASADWFLDAELVLAAERMGMRIEHHPVTMRQREHGKSNVKARTLAEFGKNILAWRLGL
jgi:GT2 family glycosyltransferase